MNKQCILIDGHNLLYRAHFALIRNPLINSRGMTTSALYNIIRIMRKLREEQKPDALAFCLDAPGPSPRKQLFASYKSSRPAPPDEIIQQLRYLPGLLQALGVPLVTWAGLEADDLIAGLAERAFQQGENVVILSSDKDLGQLVRPGIIMRTFIKGVTETIDLDESGIHEKYGVRPASIPDYLGLAGDKVDDIPGVPGIGEKTAGTLLESYSNLDDIYEHIEEVKPPRVRGLLKEYKDQAYLSRKLAVLDAELPTEIASINLTPQPEDSPRLAEMFRELEFKLAVKSSGRESKPAITTPVIPAQTLPGIPTTTQQTFIPDADFPAGVALSDAGKIAICDAGGERIISVADMPARWAIQSYKTWLEAGLPESLYPALDLELCDYLLHPELSPRTQRALELRYLGETSAVPETSLTLFSDKATQDALPSACDVRQLAAVMNGMLPPELRKLHDEMEVPLCRVLYRMEQAGIQLNTAVLASASELFKQEMVELEARIHGIAGHPFNIQSTQQLAKILFDELGLAAIRNTKTGRSTDIDVLRQLMVDYPDQKLPELVIRYRTIAKLKSTYIDALPNQLGADGRLHTRFQQTVASTGRLSSAEPNLQNIPIREPEGREIRRAFVVPPGYKLLSADYSQIELRILAHYSGDAGLCQAFERDEDIHTHTAAEIFTVEHEDVTPAMRSAAKAVNFGIAYGLSAFGLAKQLGIPQKVAAAHINKYFSRYPGVKTYIDSAIADAREHGYANTLLGRRLPLRDLHSPNAVVRQAAERVAINMPIQGTAADMMKLAMINVAKRLQSITPSDARMVLTIHDELLFEVREDRVEEIKELCEHEMRNALKLSVPIKVNISVGDNWLEAH